MNCIGTGVELVNQKIKSNPVNPVPIELVIFLFDIFFKLQCYVTDFIGIQSKGNRKFIPKKILGKKINIEVLYNWYK